MPQICLSHLRVIVLVAALVTAAKAFPGPQDPQPTQATTTQAISFSNGQSLIFYREQKLHAEDLVQRIVSSYKATDPQYKQAQIYYDTAYEKYDAYMAQALLDMTNGKKEDLSAPAADAIGAAKIFNDYVEAQTQTKAVTSDFGTVTQLIEAAVGLYDYFANRSSTKRAAYAKALTPDLTWQKWSAIISPAPPATAATPAATTPPAATNTSKPPKP
jgi:hypothetical protein